MTLLQKLLKRAFNLIRLFCLCRRYRRKLLTFSCLSKTSQTHFLDNSFEKLKGYYL